MNEKKYPMTYEEYEKRVIELLLKNVVPKEKKQLIEDLNDLLDFDPDFIRNLYGSDCYYYDHPEGFGIVNPENIFSDEVLLAIPVYNIELSL